MPVQFKAEKKNNKIIVKPVIERVGNNVTIHVPSYKLMKQLARDHGKRNLQSV